MSTPEKSGIEKFKNKLNNVDFLEENEERILEYVEKHKDNVENWKNDILEILDITGLDKKQLKVHQHEIANLIREKAEQLKIFLENHPHKLDNPFLMKGSNIYKALETYTYAIEKHNAQKIYQHLRLLNAITKNANKKLKPLEITTDRIEEIKAYLLDTVKSYEHSYDPKIKDDINKKVFFVLNWKNFSAKRIQELTDKIGLIPHSKKDKIRGIDWGYIWIQLALQANPNNEELKRTKRQLDEGTYLQPSINVIGSIQLPKEKEEMQQQTINPDKFVGKKMHLRDFLSQLSLPNGYLSVDEAMVTKEKGFGWVQKLEKNTVHVILGLASDSKEPLENHPKYIKLFMPKRLIPANELAEGTVIPLYFTEKEPNRRPSDEIGPQYKYHMKADYYDGKKHESKGAIYKAMQDAEEKKKLKK